MLGPSRPSAKRVRLMALAATAAAPLIALLVFACGDTKPATGSGDRIIDDTHPAPSSTGTAPPSGDASTDVEYGADGYAPFDACQACKCAGDSYCIGGTTGRTSIESCELPDGGPADAGAAPQIGCNYFPPACAKTPTCTCLIDALKPLFPCYPVCAQKPGGVLSVYCPNP